MCRLPDHAHPAPSASYLREISAVADRQFLEQLSRKLADDGKLIEAGWISLRIVAIPPDAGPAQLENMRNAFMAGAQHLFSSIMTVLDPGAEPTDADMTRMSLIADELAAFGEELKLRLTRATGSA
jgi:hypothetical protein